MRHNLPLDVQHELLKILRRGGEGYGVKGGQVAKVLERQGWVRPVASSEPGPPVESQAARFCDCGDQALALVRWEGGEALICRWCHVFDVVPQRVNEGRWYRLVPVLVGLRRPEVELWEGGSLPEAGEWVKRPDEGGA